MKRIILSSMVILLSCTALFSQRREWKPEDIKAGLYIISCYKADPTPLNQICYTLKSDLKQIVDTTVALQLVMHSEFTVVSVQDGYILKYMADQAALCKYLNRSTEGYRIATKEEIWANMQRNISFKDTTINQQRQ